MHTQFKQYVGVDPTAKAIFLSSAARTEATRDADIRSGPSVACAFQMAQK